jgi:hypothetical protein
MSASERENALRAAGLKGIEWVPCYVGIHPRAWEKYKEDLEDLVLHHPSPHIIGLFEDNGRKQRKVVQYSMTNWVRKSFAEYRKGSQNFREPPMYDDPVYNVGKYTDNWGTLWSNAFRGHEGHPVSPGPLADWKNLSSYKPPDPITMTERLPRASWNEIRAEVEADKKRGQVAIGNAYPDNRFFERLHFLRGFSNLMVDFFTDPPELRSLIELVIDHNTRLINKWLELDVDVITFGDDLGTQTSPMIGPKIFRKYLKPGYSRMFKPVRDAGVHVLFHSDGYILPLVDDLVECGVSILNLQANVNGIDNIREVCKGKVCLELVLDTQKMVPFGSPLDMDAHIKEAILKLDSKEGGLWLRGYCDFDTPLANIEAMIKAMEKHQTYYGPEGSAQMGSRRSRTKKGNI